VDIQVVISKATTLNADQVNSILKSNSVIRPVTIGEALSSRDFGSADELISELCKELGLEYLKDIPANDILLDLVRDISINYAKQNAILPYKEDQVSVTVLTSNPLNMRALDDLRVLFGKRIKPLITTNAKLQDAINRVFEKGHGFPSGSRGN
jgi:general secretion pathway protein E